MSDFTGKTVLVTGATGLIGSSLVDRLISVDGAKVIALGRNETKLREGFADYLDNPRFAYIVQDVCQPICLPDTTKVDYIFHAAGSTMSNVINERPLEVIDANLLGTRNCLDLLQKQGKAGASGRMVLFSSVTVYGDPSREDRAVTEKDTDVAVTLENPYAAYAETKRMSEVLGLSYYRQFGVDIVIARLSTVYGPARFYPASAFYEFIHRALKGEDICLRSANLPRRDNIYIDDAVDGLLTICAKGVSGEVYNISSNGELGGYAAVNEIAEMVAEVANRLYRSAVRVQYEHAPSGKRGGAGLRLVNDKIHELGWRVQTDFKQGIEKTLMKLSSQKRTGG